MEPGRQVGPSTVPGQGQGFFLLVDRDERLIDLDGDVLGRRGALLGRRCDDALRGHSELLALVHAGLSGSSGRAAVRFGSRLFEVQVQPRLGDDGHVFGAFVVGTASATSPELRLLFDQMPGAIWTVDRELTLTFAFGRLVRSRQLRERAVIGERIDRVLGTEDPDHPALVRHRAALEGRPGIFEIELYDRWYRVRVQPLSASDGAVIGAVGVAVDCTDPRRLNEELTFREARLSEAQRLAHVGSFTWELDSQKVTWSDELYAIYGVRPGSFAPSFEAFLDRVLPEDRELTRARTMEAIERRTQVEYTHRIRRPDESIAILRTRAAPVLDPDGHPVRVVGSCWDVTEQDRAHRELEHTVSVLRSTLHATADGILVVDLEGRRVVLNEQFLSLWHIPKHIAQSPTDEAMLAYVEEQLADPNTFRAKVAQLYATPEAESFDVLHFKDGRVFERYSRPQLLDGKPIGRVWSFRDVTDRERLYRRALFLANSSRLLASLEIEPALQSVAELAVPSLADACAFDLFVEGNPRRVVDHTSGRARVPRELPSSVFSGHSSIERGASNDTITVPIQARGELVGALSITVAHPRRLNGADLELPEELAGRAALSIDHARMYRHASEALEARDEFLTVAAHEVRMPITSIHLALHRLRQIAPAEAAPLFELLERAQRRLNRLVQELVDTGALRGAGFRLHYERGDFGEIVREAVRELEPDLRRSHSPLEIRTEGALQGRWDRERLLLLVGNLVGNAIKFGGGKPIELTARGNGDRVKLVVRDHGLGISAPAREKLFQPYGRAVSPQHFGGLGLGLYIAAKIVEAFGGTISLESAIGKGSAFTVELPREPAAS
jgi:signal transduction histidine kinase/PAS domain-containing protein